MADFMSSHHPGDFVTDLARRTPTWNNLPGELRNHILGFAIAIGKQKPKSRILSICSTVCREWQRSVEIANFESLTVDGEDMEELGKAVVGCRRRWLKKIILKIELAKYPKRLWRVPETDHEKADNDMVFTLHIVDLLRILSNWKVDDTPGMELELIIRSPSDIALMNGTGGLTLNGESRFLDSFLDFALIELGWFGPHGIPVAHVIKCLSITRRCWRNIEAMALLTLVSSLPRLVEVRYEPFQHLDEGTQEGLDLERARLLGFWPPGIRRLSMFEHFEPYETLCDKVDEDEEDDGFEDDDSQAPSFATGDEEVDNELPPPYGPLAVVALKRSVHLEELAASFMIDASQFLKPFSDRHPELPHWPKLRWLALTSSAIHQGDDPEGQNKLYCTAARAAKRMPKLEAMELFNTCRHGAGVFRYLVTGTSAFLSFEATWDHELGNSVKSAWREAAMFHASKELCVIPEKHIGPYKSSTHFLFGHLMLRDLILHPTSSRELIAKRNITPGPALKLP